MERGCHARRLVLLPCAPALSRGKYSFLTRLKSAIYDTDMAQGIGLMSYFPFGSLAVIRHGCEIKDLDIISHKPHFLLTYNLFEQAFWSGGTFSFPADTTATFHHKLLMAELNVLSLENGGSKEYVSRECPNYAMSLWGRALCPSFGRPAEAMSVPYHVDFVHFLYSKLSLALIGC